MADAMLEAVYEQLPEGQEVELGQLTRALYVAGQVDAPAHLLRYKQRKELVYRLQLNEESGNYDVMVSRSGGE